MVFTADQLLQIILTALGILGTLLGAWAFSMRSKAIAERDRVKADAQVKLATAEADKLRIQAEADAKVKEAEAELNQSLKDRESSAAINRLVERQLDIIQKMDETNKARDEEHLSRYSTSIAVSKDINTQLSNLYDWANKMSEWKDTATGLLQKTLESVEALPSRVAAPNTASLTTFAQHLGAEMGQVLAAQLQIQRLDKELFPFPDAEDTRWETVFLKPTSPNVAIQKQPFYKDDVVLKKDCAKIAPEGERVRIIRGQLLNWLIVYKLGIDADCWGWIPEGRVQIVEGAPAMG